MNAQRMLLLVMTILEILAGLGLLLVPGLALRVLLGTEQPATETIAVVRLAGVALVAIGVMSRAGEGASAPAGRSLLTGLAIYNVGACAVLAYIGAGLGLSGPILWPAVALHAALAVWTIACLRPATH